MLTGKPVKETASSNGSCGAMRMKKFAVMKQKTTTMDTENALITTQKELK